MPERQCPNWLTTFRDWSVVRSEAPESFHFWTGLFVLSSVLRRKIKVPKKLLGGYDLSPNLYIIFVAPPGAARKTTTGGYAESLLQHITQVNKAATYITVEQLLKRLSETSDSSVSIFSAEFATFIKKSGPGMFDALTDLYDGRESSSVDTILRGLEFAGKPCVNLLACTTPKWVSENMPEYVIGGGFASRVIFVFEEKIRRAQLYYEGVDHNALELLRLKLVSDLEHLADKIEGEFSLDEDAKMFMEGWYSKFQNNPKKTDDGRMAGYFERKTSHIHKIAMLLHLAESDELVLYEQDFQRAISVIEMIERKMPKTFSHMGKNPYSAEIDAIRDYILVKQRVTRAQILARFCKDLPIEKIPDVLAFLIAEGTITLIGDPLKPIYTPNFLEKGNGGA